MALLGSTRLFGSSLPPLSPRRFVHSSVHHRPWVPLTPCCELLSQEAWTHHLSIPQLSLTTHSKVPVLSWHLPSLSASKESQGHPHIHVKPYIQPLCPPPAPFQFPHEHLAPTTLVLLAIFLSSLKKSSVRLLYSLGVPRPQVTSNSTCCLVSFAKILAIDGPLPPIARRSSWGGF